MDNLMSGMKDFVLVSFFSIIKIFWWHFYVLWTLSNLFHLCDDDNNRQDAYQTLLLFFCTKPKKSAFYILLLVPKNSALPCLQIYVCWKKMSNLYMIIWKAFVASLELPFAIFQSWPRCESAQALDI